jgi:ABC-type ATPase with predicted acetyltransferase domain
MKKPYWSDGNKWLLNILCEQRANVILSEAFEKITELEQSALNNIEQPAPVEIWFCPKCLVGRGSHHHNICPNVCGVVQMKMREVIGDEEKT